MTLDEARALKSGDTIIVRTPWGQDQEPLLVDKWDEAVQGILVILPMTVHTNPGGNVSFHIAYQTARKL